MDRAEMIVRLALMDGFIDQRQAASIIGDYRGAAPVAKTMPPTEEWASVSGWITPDQAGMLQAQLNRSQFRCGCGWEGVGGNGTLAPNGNAIICPECGTGELVITKPADLNTASFTPPPPMGSASNHGSGHGSEHGSGQGSSRLRPSGGAGQSQSSSHHSGPVLSEEVSLFSTSHADSDSDSDDEVSLLPKEALQSRSGRQRVRPGNDLPSGRVLRASQAGTGPLNFNVENLSPGTMIDDWRVEKKVGEGAVGIVYRAVDVQLERPVAIKVLGAELLANSMQIERFRQEARVLAQLEHPNILAIYRLGNVGHRPYIVMQWIDGESLADRIRRQMRTPGLVVEFDMLVQAARGLQAAHDKRIVHRDVKPDNLMITREGVIKVADFGLAQHQDSNQLLSRAGSFIGTPAYASPEQIEGQADVDARSDIYALGITAFELATGRLPWQVDSLVDLLYHQKKTPLPMASSLNPDAPPEFDELLVAMCAKHPVGRIQTMGEVVEALEQLADRAADVSIDGSGRTRMRVKHEDGEQVVYLSNHDSGVQRDGSSSGSGEHGGLTGAFMMSDLYPAARPDFDANPFQGHAEESLDEAIGEIGRPLDDSDAAILNLRPETARDTERMRDEFKAILMGATPGAAGTPSAKADVSGYVAPKDEGSKLMQVKASEVSKRLEALAEGEKPAAAGSTRQQEVRLTATRVQHLQRGPKFSLFHPKVLLWILIAGLFVAAGMAKSGLIDLPFDIPFLKP